MMGDNTSSTDAVWRELTARIAHPAGANLDPDGDLLQRHLLCQATGCHDERNGRCIDCGKTLAPGDPVADTGRGL